MVEEGHPSGVVYSFLCDPDNAIFTPGSILQGHALWHGLTAVSFFLIYLFFRTEEGAE
jgi:hypothetical protein